MTAPRHQRSRRTRRSATYAPFRNHRLSDAGLTPVQAVLEVLDQELGAMTGWLAAQEDASQSREAVRRSGDLIRATPAPAHEQVTADVRRAARLIDTALRTFAAPCAARK